MSMRYIAVLASSTALSFAGLQWWVFSFLARNGVGLEDTGHAVEVLVGSKVTIALVANLAVHMYILLVLCLKMMFFKQLYSSESRKLMEQLINYVLYKGTFLPLVVPPNLTQTVLWSTWLIVLCSLKMFQSLAKDRLERLNASPITTPITYIRVFSALLFVLSADMFWLRLCMVVHTSFRSNLFLLLFFEPLSIAFETLMAIIVYGFHLIEVLHRHSVDNGTDFLGLHDFYKSAAGSLVEWKGHFIRNCGFLMEMMASLMGAGHYMMIWWLHGMAFHLVDAILFLNLRAIISASVKRMRGFIKLKKALNSLDRALPDATKEELYAFDDECAICRGAMVKAKKLSCNHLFHLSCLRSWLDQGLPEAYSCPTCRRPLLASSSQNRTNPLTQRNGQTAEQATLRDESLRISAHVSPDPTFPHPQQNPSNTLWSGVGLDSTWVPPWTSQLDGASTSNAIRSVGLTGVQMMMRQLASASENYAQSSMDPSPWNLWPGLRASPSSPPQPSLNHNRNASGLRFRTTSNTAPSSDLLAMVDQVREVLPHMPVEVILLDLIRTNNINITVNNLLLMQ